MRLSGSLRIELERPGATGSNGTVRFAKGPVVTQPPPVLSVPVKFTIRLTVGAKLRITIGPRDYLLNPYIQKNPPPPFALISTCMVYKNKYHIYNANKLNCVNNTTYSTILFDG